MLTILFRALAIALLAISVPVQGFAAVSAGICMAPGQHDSGETFHHHGAGDAAPDSAAGPHHDGGAADSHTSHGSHCVSCIAAIAPHSGSMLPDVAASQLVPARLVFLQNVAPQRLDRPPLAL